MNFLKRSYGKLSLAALAFVAMVSQCYADLVEVADPPTLSGVTFNPGELVTPILTAIIATVGVAAVIWLVIIGVRWIRSFMGHRA